MNVAVWSLEEATERGKEQWVDLFRVDLQLGVFSFRKREISRSCNIGQKEKVSEEK